MKGITIFLVLIALLVGVAAAADGGVARLDVGMKRNRRKKSHPAGLERVIGGELDI